MEKAPKSTISQKTWALLEKNGWQHWKISSWVLKLSEQAIFKQVLEASWFLAEMFIFVIVKYDLLVFYCIKYELLLQYRWKRAARFQYRWKRAARVQYSWKRAAHIYVLDSCLTAQLGMTLFKESYTKFFAPFGIGRALQKIKILQTQRTIRPRGIFHSVAIK